MTWIFYLSLIVLGAAGGYAYAVTFMVPNPPSSADDGTLPDAAVAVLSRKASAFTATAAPSDQ